MMASDDVIAERKAQAEKAAAKKGHRIGDWNLEASRWHAKCINKRCRGRVTVSRDVDGIAAGLTVFSSRCPYTRL